MPPIGVGSSRPCPRGQSTPFRKKIKNAKDQTLPDGLICPAEEMTWHIEKRCHQAIWPTMLRRPVRPLRPARHPASLRMPTSRSHARTRAHTALTPTTQRAPSTQRRIHRRRSLRAHAPPRRDAHIERNEARSTQEQASAASAEACSRVLKTSCTAAATERLSRSLSVESRTVCQLSPKCQ